MGIGNQIERPSRSPGRIKPSSLPLMGIGNRTLVGKSLVNPWAVLTTLITPHGDRERDRWSERDAAVHVLELITPHGDRELRSPSESPRSGLCLITPHGDREPPLAEATSDASRQCQLITPHGDREPGDRASKHMADAPKPILITPHGDRETTQKSSKPTSAARLITPHGDREPSLFRVFYTLDASETTPNTAVDLPICAWTPVWR